MGDEDKIFQTEIIRNQGPQSGDKSAWRKETIAFFILF
ncbi:Uncharacterized protein dnm_044310 [Desulfonema magnum]|uniref:Uncharacterized protein n=1 Tax=Desulfonema magnum TaxID=45655 RepID=A0A975BMV9_9BACT|nr:Uncharacterized protein dnm_044310 [Desulfonema magnum]